MKPRRFLALLFLSSFLLLPCAFAADISITAANVVPSTPANIITGTAGATITAGAAVYFDTASKTYKLADADASATTAKVAGLAVNGAASGQPVNICTKDPSFTLGGTVAAGTIVVLSGTAGAVAPAADLATGDYAGIIGVGIGSNKINLGILRADVVTP